MTISNSEIDEKERVNRIVASAGDNPYLIGFEAVGIQRFVTASQRPIAMQGASALLKEFDDENRKLNPIFSGGARGLLVTSHDKVDELVKELKVRFTKATDGLPLAVTPVPFWKNKEKDSLQLLWLKQRLAHDACDPDHVDLKQSREICVDCQLRPADVDSQRPDSAGERICRRCDKCVKKGQNEQHSEQQRWTFEDMAENNLIAMISADGNQLGQFFRSLNTLHELAIGSKTVFDIFSSAHAKALNYDPKCVAPVTGGDDIKVLMRPSRVLTYAKDLMNEVEKCAEAKAKKYKSILSSDSLAQLNQLGVGVGLLIAPHYFPASRLAALSHRLEDKAKVWGKEKNVRSSVSYAVFRSGSEPDEAMFKENLPVSGSEWDAFIQKVLALRTVPPTQRSNAAAAFDLEKEERENLLRYQLARHKSWQKWFMDCGVHWKTQDYVTGVFPTRGMLALASMEKN